MEVSRDLINIFIKYMYLHIQVIILIKSMRDFIINVLGTIGASISGPITTIKLWNSFSINNDGKSDFFHQFPHL